MHNYPRIAALLLSLTLVLASTAAAGNLTAPGAPDADPGIGISQASDSLLLATTGGKTNWSCVGAVLTFSFFALGTGAATGGVGLAIAGAYAPIALVACA